MSHSKRCALLYLGDPCSHSVLCSGHLKKWSGYWEQPLEPAPAKTAKGQQAWEPIPEQGPPECGSHACSASALLVTVGPC